MLFCSFVMQSQDYFKTYDSLKKVPKINIGIITDSLIDLSDSESKHVISAKIAHAYSVDLFIKGKYDQALIYAGKEVEFLKLVGQKDKTFEKALLHFQFHFQKLNRFQKEGRQLRTYWELLA